MLVGGNMDEDVVVSHDELPSTTRSTPRIKMMKNKLLRKKRKNPKRKRLRKGPMASPAGGVIPVGYTFDMSCLLSKQNNTPKFIKPPQIPHSLGPKFIRRKTEKHKYFMAIYRCRPGFKLHNPRFRSLGCHDGKWVGSLPICLANRRKIGCINAGCEHECKEINRKPECYCFKGFFQHGKSCLDINECAINNGGCQNSCHNTPGSFYCSCTPGYRLASDHSSCVDVNECVSRNGHGPCQGHCINMEGSYQCSCESVPGTQLAPDGIRCEDINECDTLGCSHSCVNTFGSAFCLCPAGFILGTDYTICQDIDECSSLTANCSHDCINTQGSYICSCPTGFVLQEDGNTCIDIDECLELSKDLLCSHICQNIIGSYECLCPPDYELSTDHRTCHQKEDKCQEKNCSHDCFIDNDLAVCICDNGYILEEGVQCVDIDECTEGTSGCSHDCINEDGRFYCACPKGMELFPDMKTCGVGKFTSNSKSVPKHYNSSESSSCLEGYQMINSSCEDIDECSMSPNLCSQICYNTKGSYECICKDGFKMSNDKNTCIDVDECSLGNICNGNICINTEGSYICKCGLGYKLMNNVQTCEDIDECSLADEESPICSHICINLEGTFRCECPPGFVLSRDLRTCEDLDECADNNNISEKCSHGCVNVIGSYYCECPQGYVFNEYEEFAMQDSKQCIDVDECRKNNGGCSQKCSNTEGSFYCACISGYQLQISSGQCLDINECANNDSVCEQVCQNTEGSFNCECKDGFKLSSDKATCDDIDECLLNVSNCNQICKNTVGGFLCECYKGFKQINETHCIEENLKELDENHTNKQKSFVSNHLKPKTSGCMPFVMDNVNVEVDCGLNQTWYDEETVCFINCKAGYTLGGANLRVCQHDGSWTGGNFSCKVEVEPFIRCPPEIRRHLPLGENNITIEIPKPKSNVDWDKQVYTKPAWGKQLTATLPSGLTIVKFTAISADSGHAVMCNVSIHIIDAEKPTIVGCPEEITVMKKTSKTMVQVNWNEPIIKDNVKISRIYQSKKPGDMFAGGFHMVTYVAFDSSGNIATCQFSINITDT